MTLDVGGLPRTVAQSADARGSLCLQAEYHKQYGPMFKESWADKEQFHVGDPHLIETIMRTQDKHHPDRPPIQAWRLYRKITEKPLGLVTS